MKPTALLLALACLAACGTNKADRYAPAPDDGSVNANSADVSDNPPIVQPDGKR